MNLFTTDADCENSILHLEMECSGSFCVAEKQAL